MDEMIVNAKCDNRPERFLYFLEERAKELVPDYPFGTGKEIGADDAFEWLWAITSSLEGTREANKDLHKRISSLERACDIFEENSRDSVEMWELLREIDMQISNLPVPIRERLSACLRPKRPKEKGSEYSKM